MKALLPALPLCLILGVSCQKPAEPVEKTAAAAVVPVVSCEDAEKAADGGPFVHVTSPAPGDQVATGFEVRGCSRTFESTVNWTLKDKDGGILASGHAKGGGVDGAGPFSFKVAFTIPSAQTGALEVYEEDQSDGEGPARPKTVLPVMLSM